MRRKMNTNHNSTAVEQDFVPWLERAKLHAGADVRVIGSGRWMLTTCHDRQRCFLFETRSEADRHKTCQHCYVTDLTSPTRAENAEEIEARAERRAKRNAEALKAAIGRA